jgi:regulator of RNase E activity RraA
MANVDGEAVNSLDPRLAELLGTLATATLAAQLRRHGLDGAVMGGLTAMHPGAKMIGRARTLRYLPYRDDLASALGMTVQRGLVESLEPGDIIVIEARAEAGSGTIGDISALRAKVRGASGIVSDGPLRDSSVIASLDLPVYFSGTHPSAPTRRHVPFAADVAVGCAGVLVTPGDILVGDADGVVLLPPAVAYAIATDAAAQEREERFVAEQVAKGESLTGLFPMGEQWRARYEQWDEPLAP